MEAIEPILRLVKYQLQEVLPVNLANAGPAQATDETILFLPPPKPQDVVTTLASLTRERYPFVAIIIDSTTPVDADALQSCPEDASQRHTFSILFGLSDSEKNAEDLIYKVSRYAQVIKDTIRDYSPEALDDAFTASRLDPVDLVFEAGATNYSETDRRNSLLVRECVIEFACYS